MNTDLLQQLIFECAMDLARGEDTKENIVTRLLELSDVKITQSPCTGGHSPNA